MTRKFLVADLLCGAVGSSTGCARALAELGLQMELVCVNHWPVAIETHSSQRARDVDSDPLPTLTTANRGELAFITAQFGERPSQAPRVHDIDQPSPAICATGHINLIEGTPQYDILFRMLEPHELAAAMGFDSEDSKYEFAGTKTEQIKQIGNAVSVAMMKAEVKAIMADTVRAAARDEARKAGARRAAS